MGRTPTPDRHTLKMKEEHEKVKKQMEELEKKYLQGCDTKPDISA